MPTKQQLQQIADYLDTYYGLPEGTLDRMMAKETQYGTIMNNPTFPDAKGILQQRDIFAAEVKRLFNFDYDRMNPVDAMRAAAMYLSWAYRKFAAWDMAVASYNWSWPAVWSFMRAKARGLKPKMPRETINYIRAVVPQFAQ